MKLATDGVKFSVQGLFWQVKMCLFRSMLLYSFTLVFSLRSCEEIGAFLIYYTYVTFVF